MNTKDIRFGAEKDMLGLFEGRARELQRRLADDGIDVFLMTNADSIFYYTAYWGDLGLEFGRPTIVVVPKSGDITLITASSEVLMAKALTWVEDVVVYSDGIGTEWREPLAAAMVGISSRSRVAIERIDIPGVISDTLRDDLGIAEFVDGSRIVGDMRMIKSAEELDMVRQAGQVAVAMGIAGKAAIGEGVPE